MVKRDLNGYLRVEAPVPAVLEICARPWTMSRTRGARGPVAALGDSRQRVLAKAPGHARAGDPTWPVEKAVPLSPQGHPGPGVGPGPVVLQRAGEPGGHGLLRSAGVAGRDECEYR